MIVAYISTAGERKKVTPRKWCRPRQAFAEVIPQFLFPTHFSPLNRAIRPLWDQLRSYTVPPRSLRHTVCFVSGYMQCTTWWKRLFLLSTSVTNLSHVLSCPSHPPASQRNIFLCCLLLFLPGFHSSRAELYVQWGAIAVVFRRAIAVSLRRAVTCWVTTSHFQ